MAGSHNTCIEYCIHINFSLMREKDLPTTPLLPMIDNSIGGKKKNERIRQSTKITDITKRITQLKWVYAGQIARIKGNMEDEIECQSRQEKETDVDQYDGTMILKESQIIGLNGKSMRGLCSILGANRLKKKQLK